MISLEPKNISFCFRGSGGKGFLGCLRAAGEKSVKWLRWVEERSYGSGAVSEARHSTQGKIGPPLCLFFCFSGAATVDIY